MERGSLALWMRFLCKMIEFVLLYRAMPCHAMPDDIVCCNLLSLVVCLHLCVCVCVCLYA